MSDAKSEQEPTMEEILASIRRIISDEESAEGQNDQPAPDQAAEPEPEDDKDDPVEEDVLDLTDVVNDDGTVTDLTQEEPSAEEKTDIEPDNAPESEPLDEAEMTPEPVPELPELAQDETGQFEVAEDPNPNGIVSNMAADEAAVSLSSLAGAVSGARGIPLGAGSKTLEDLVKELLRPMLKEWLDENLPLLVERLVEREIHRISGRADDD